VVYNQGCTIKRLSHERSSKLRNKEQIRQTGMRKYEYENVYCYSPEKKCRAKIMQTIIKQNDRKSTQLS